MARDDAARVVRHIGANVRALRIARGFSQAQLAERIDRQLNYLQKIEYGTAMPTIPTLVSIATALDVPIARLFRPRKPVARRVGRPKTARASKVAG